MQESRSALRATHGTKTQGLRAIWSGASIRLVYCLCRLADSVAAVFILGISLTILFFIFVIYWFLAVVLTTSTVFPETVVSEFR